MTPSQHLINTRMGVGIGLDYTTPLDNALSNQFIIPTFPFISENDFILVIILYKVCNNYMYSSNCSVLILQRKTGLVKDKVYCKSSI